MIDPITRICHPYCELLGSIALLIMVVMFFCVLGYIYVERWRARRRDCALDTARDRQLAAYRRSKGVSASGGTNDGGTIDEEPR